MKKLNVLKLNFGHSHTWVGGPFGGAEIILGSIANRLQNLDSLFHLELDL